MADDDLKALTHTLKNHLAIILGYSEMLLAEMTADDPRHTDISEIKKAADAALDVLNHWHGSSTDEEAQ